MDGMNHELIELIEERITPQIFETIMDNYYSNVFVTDGEGRILYANQKTADALDCPRMEMMNMTVQQLHNQGYTSKSTTAMAIKECRQVAASYYNRHGKELATVSTPVFDNEGKITMVVTYSAEMNTLDAFVSALKADQLKLENIQKARHYMEEQLQNSIVVLDEASRQVFSIMKDIAQTDSTVMLYGETGVGKDVAATYIQKNSRRSDEIMIPVNCAAIPRELVEAELFGYEKGAFTGANAKGKPGLFELADGGTIFLDEIGELPLNIQAKLLRVLETGDFWRVGGTKERHTDVRVIGATNRNLRAMVEQKTFREDLYYRLNVVPLTLLPLRERPLDLEGLTNKFLNEYNRKFGVDRKLSMSFWEKIRQYAWPGNIRELQNTMERYVLTGNEFIAAEVDERTPGFVEKPIQLDNMHQEGALKDVMNRVEKEYIKKVLLQCDGKVSEAAKRLGVHQSVLYKKIKKAGLTWKLV